MQKEAIELRHLRYFVALAEELSFSRAAARCNVSQPPFSVAIQQLESFLGQKLILRNSRNVELSDAGRAFHFRARNLIAQASQSFDEMRAFDGALRRRLNIGFHASMIYRGLGDLMQAFGQAHPDVQVCLHEMSTIRQRDSIQRGDLDMGFAHSLVQHDVPRIGCLNLFRERFLVCIPSSYRVPDGPVRIDSFRDENFIIFNRDSSPFYFDTILSICAEAGFVPRIEHQVSQWLTAVSFVSIGMGIAVVPECLARTGTHGVAFRPIATDIAAHVQCMYAPTADGPLIAPMLELVPRYIRPHGDSARHGILPP